MCENTLERNGVCVDIRDHTASHPPLYKAGPDSFGRIDDLRGTPLIPKGQTLLQGTFRNCKEHFQSGALRGER